MRALGAAAAAAWLAAAAAVAPARAASSSRPSSPPDLSTAPWANVPSPLSLSSFRGRPVILEFSDPWSDEGERALLRAQAAQAAHPDAAALVSVRTPGPGDDAGTAALEREALRRRILTPMVEDAAGILARAYGVDKRPAQVLLDARGRFSSKLGPADDPGALAKAVDQLVARAREDHELWTSMGPAAPAWDRYAEGPLAFPAALAYDPATDTLAVSDTGHDRVVLADGRGRVKLVAGYGAPGYRDGAPADAGFNRPRGLAFTGAQLGVADAANDYIRVVERTPRPRVSSWFGGVPDFHWPLSLLVTPETTYFGSAAEHALWAVDRAGRRRYKLFGGSAGDRDGSPAVARLREPHALALVGDTLYIAEPEARRLRATSLAAPELTTPALTGAPLRRPLGLAALGGMLYIADGGDGALKRLDPKTGRVETLASGLARPSAVAAVRGELVVAEADASRLSRFDPSGKPLGRLVLKGLAAPAHGPPPPPLPARSAAVDSGPAQAVRAGAADRLRVDVELPAGMELNARAPLTARFSEAVGPVTVPLSERRRFSLPPRAHVELGFTPAEGSATLFVDVDFFYCRADRKGLCFAASKRYKVDVEASRRARQRAARLVVRP